jgi:UPF0755 protein
VKWLLLIFVVFTLSAVAGFGWWSKQLEPVDSSSNLKVSFVIPKNQPAGIIVEQLAEQKLIKSSLAGKIYLRISNLAAKIQPGAYVVSPSQTMQQILLSLTEGPQDVWVTIPEGWRREQIAQRLNSTLEGPNKLFVAEEFLDYTRNLEGQLFPDTYLIPANATAEQAANIMLGVFASKSGLDLPADKSTLIVASLVERETRSDAERPTVAGIIWKRLAAGWPLQIDATVQYAQDTATCAQVVLNCEWWETLNNTRFVSTFNTYLHTGLPPTPIANPGLSSIQAAINPVESDYWYYLHADDGQIYFASTIEQHNSNIDKYLR